MNRSPAFTSTLRLALGALTWILVFAFATPSAAQTATPPPPAPDAGAEAPSDDEAPPSSAAEAAPSPDGGTSPETAAAHPGAGDEATSEAESAVTWAGRDSEINESNTVTGGVGLLRTQHAESGAPGQFRIGFVGEWFSAGFLCTVQFPCAQGLITSDTMNHIGGTLSLGVSIAKIGAGTLEAYASTSAYANSDSANRPALLQVLGDSNLALKYAAPIGSIVRLGLFTELWLINASGSVGLDGSGTSAKFGGVGTLDFRGLSAHVPLRFSTNIVYSLDNTGDVLTDVELARGQAAGSVLGRQPVTRIERFGLGVNRVDHVDLLFGLEAMLVDERIRPFVEARLLIPSNRQGYQCITSNPSGDQCLANDSVVPSTLTIGARVFPWKRGFSLLAGIDVGMTGVSNFIEELSPVPPWVLYFGAGWAVDTWDRPPVVRSVEKVVEKGRNLVHVTGFVHEKDKNDPVANAIVTYRDHADLSPLATAADGKFGDDVAPGPYTFDVKADGYKPGSCDVTVSPGKPVNVDCPLEALPRVGTVVGRVRDADSNEPLGSVQVVLADPQHKELRLTTDASGGFRFENVAPGTAELSVIAEGYLALVSPADVKPRQESSVDLLLRPKPKQPKVQVTAKEITIKEQIQFALDSAVILPQSFEILTEVADTLIRHAEIRRIEVQGHTDNSGTAEHNRTLSDERAEAVRAWLVQHGVVAERLVARGYGQDNPLVPNVTAANRAKNRRVQFIILDRSDMQLPPPAAAAPAGGPAVPAPAAPPPAAPPLPPPPPTRKPDPLPGF
jgi:outer membrane protein OmpA-like peptidoglycan-associated protein